MRLPASLLAAGLAALSFSAYAAVPARFVEYVRFTGANDGTKATYVQPVSTLAFTARNVTAYIDFRPSQTQPSADWSTTHYLRAAYIMGSLSDAPNKQSAVGLKNVGDQWYLAYFSGTTEGITIPITLGNRYRVGTSSNSTISTGFMQMRALPTAGALETFRFSSSTRHIAIPVTATESASTVRTWTFIQ